MARILCVWSPNWPITAWRRRTPSPPPAEAAAEPAPFALVITDGGTRRLAAVDGLAQALGLYPGQKAADAAALVPNLVTDLIEPCTAWLLARSCSFHVFCLSYSFIKVRKRDLFAVHFTDVVVGTAKEA